MSNGKVLRYPRRFGALLWTKSWKAQRCAHLGPEPLSDDFNGRHGSEVREETGD